MTFNEGMQIDTSTTASSGGGGGRGIAIGGGLGGLLFLVVALLTMSGAYANGLTSGRPLNRIEEGAA